VTPAELIQKLPLTSGAPKGYRKIGIKQVDAFTDAPLTGNPAGVVMNAADLSDQQMQTIAREMSVPETAFVLPPSTHDADLRIRWFTPQTEVPICGHATIAAFHALAEEGLHGMKGEGTYVFRLETKSGLLPVNVEKHAGGTDVLFGLSVPEFVRAGQYKLDIMRVLNITLEDFENRKPIVLADYLYVPIRRLHTIFSMKPNFFTMSQFLTNRSLRGLCVFTTETIDRRSSVHSRFFAPTLGINEDPVTGSANGPLGVYLFEQGELDRTGETVTIIGEQGDAIGRKGRVIIQMTVQEKKVTSLKIGGRAVTVLDGEMMVT
jgi:trans-2,3-dihydro-3-hydroxyanthranilate isomerase